MCRRRHRVQMTGDGRVLKTGSRQTAGNANIVKVPAAMLVVYFVTMSISIHAPRVGSDLDKSLGGMLTTIFQSTLPVWGATSTCIRHKPRV